MSIDSELRREVRALTSRLGNIVREQAGRQRLHQIERLRGLAKQVRTHHRPADVQSKRALVTRLSVAAAYDIAHAFSLFFQLVNVCEERARIRNLRAQAIPRQSLRALFLELRAARVPAKAVQACLDRLYIEPVLTAHPTESKRRTALNHLLRLTSIPPETDEILETLWQTEEVRYTRVSPMNEVENTLFLFDRTIVDAAGRFYQVFDEELARAYPTVRRAQPFLQFGSWVGGDRDGNPFVTPEVSESAVNLHRESILAHYRTELIRLIEEITHASPTIAEAPLPGTGFHHRESCRMELDRLLKEIGQPTLTASDFAARLEAVRQQLIRQRARRAAHGRLQRLIHVVRCFGFHLAHLDFRDHSGRLKDAPDEVRAEIAAMGRIQEKHGEPAAHRFILSMTHSVDDMDRLLKLSREAGVSRVDLVPLFETISDLDGAERLVRALWSHPEYRQHLQSRGNSQEIMMGYSDSNKDGGYLAANWMLFRAQRAIVAAGRDHGIDVLFFHGKGGSIDRGGGMSHRSLRAQPDAANGARLRVTEQGEVVSLKYGNPDIAQRNLEQLTSAVIAATCRDKDRARVPPEWEQAMDELAGASCSAYQDLVYRTPEFADYFWSATPIDLIEHLRIGSRPAKRHDSKDIVQLRAIPWVFAWTQSRHLLPAWYGIGHALESAGPDGVDRLRTMYRTWPFFRMILDNAEASLAKADMYIASRYADLVRDAAVRDRIFGRIEGEYRRTIRMVLQVTGHSRLLDNQARFKESIKLRNPYVDPLHYIQIRFLDTWRKTDPKHRTEEMRRLLALTVNGIAYGMKSTG